MPYTKKNLPDHVQKLSDKAQRQWMHIANGCLADGKPEGKCITMANGVVKSSKEWAEPLTDEEAQEVEGAKQYQYVDSYEILDKQVSQDQAKYNALGATSTKGCANCQWFLAPSRCVVVAGQISPTGISDLWMAQIPFAQTPLLVEIVASPTQDTKASDGTHPTVVDHPRTEPDIDDKNPKDPKKRPKAGQDSPTTADKFMGAVKELWDRFRGGDVSTPPKPFSLYRTKDNRVRFLTAWSNNFYDREGEVFPEYAHKEYIEWADRNQQYPELWLWHTKGTKYGQVDWLDYTDGFVYASGLIDVGYEDLAQALVEEDCGVSHGFHGLQRGKEVILYRPFEISTLPRTNAAVWTTSFNIIGEGAKEMAFTQQTKDWLKAHGLDDAAITAAETTATNLSKSLRDLGVAYKDTDLVEEPTPVATEKAKAPPFGSEKADEEEDAADAKKKKKDVEFQEIILANSNKQTEILTALATSVAALSDRVKAVEATDDQKIAATIAARNPATNGVSASKDTTNVVGQEQVNKDADFFGKTFLENLVGAAPTSQ